MADKEIIIDGIDVSECYHLKYDHIGCDIDETYCFGSDCYFKQLAITEQKLDEIKTYCLKDIHTFADGTKMRYEVCDDILTIINKKEGD